MDPKLIAATLAVFVGFGILSIYGIADYAVKSRQDRGFPYSQEYLKYMHKMDRLAFPLALALVVLLSLCIPQRIIPEDKLLLAGAVVLGAGALGLLRGVKFAVGVVLAIASAVQLSTLLLLLAGKKLRFTAKGFYKKLGSTLVHLGIVLIALSIVQPEWVFAPMAVFWGCTGIVALGMMMLFYFPERRHGIESGYS